MLVFGDTVDEGEEEVGEEVEGDEADEQPVRLGARQLRLLQVYSEEYAHDPQDLGRVSCTATTTFISVFTCSKRITMSRRWAAQISCKVALTFISIIQTVNAKRCLGVGSRFLQSNGDIHSRLHI